MRNQTYKNRPTCDDSKNVIMLNQNGSSVRDYLQEMAAELSHTAQQEGLDAVATHFLLASYEAKLTKS